MMTTPCTANTAAAIFIQINDPIMLPSLFLAHGTPMNALSDTPFSRDWQKLATAATTPTAILCISAHWCTRGTFVTANSRPPTIHDFRGFPQALFDVQYSCPGHPQLAEKIAASVDCASVQASQDWGLDHGSWSLLVHLFPEANIPVLQLSLDLSQPPEFHFQLGKELAWLRDEGVLVIGSGNIVHNIAKWMSDPNGPFDWARDFDQRIAQALRDGDDDTLIHYQRLPCAADAVPTAEHYLPLLYIAGMRRPGDKLTMSDFPPTSLEQCSMRSLRYG